MDDQKYREKVPDLWDEWENETHLMKFSNEKIDLSSNKETTHQDNVRLWKEANQRVPDVEILNSPRTVYKPSLKILRRSTDNSNDSSSYVKLQEKLLPVESDLGHREKEQRYREVRQKIFGAPSIEKDSYVPIRSPVGPCLERGFSRGKDRA